jgi:hypothetical protein
MSSKSTQGIARRRARTIARKRSEAAKFELRREWGAAALLTLEATDAGLIGLCAGAEEEAEVIEAFIAAAPHELKDILRTDGLTVLEKMQELGSLMELMLTTMLSARPKSVCQSH